MSSGGRDAGASDIQSPLASSMLLLAEAIETDISSQFDLLTRRKPELCCDAAKTQENSSKNRYRDILPCKSTHLNLLKLNMTSPFNIHLICSDDKTRVHLLHSPSGDYINANHITMEIPSSGVVNRYIAAQGTINYPVYVSICLSPSI